jgi:hypothetical protein
MRDADNDLADFFDGLSRTSIDEFMQIDCAADGGRRAQPQKSPGENIDKPNWTVNLFPNPNNGNFAIISSNEQEILEIAINDSPVERFTGSVYKPKSMCLWLSFPCRTAHT